MHWLTDYKFRLRVVSVQTFYSLYCSPEIQSDRLMAFTISQYSSLLIIFTYRKRNLNYITFCFCIIHKWPVSITILQETIALSIGYNWPAIYYFFFAKSFQNDENTSNCYYQWWRRDGCWKSHTQFWNWKADTNLWKNNQTLLSLEKLNRRL